MKKKIDPNLVFRKEQIFEDAIQRMIDKMNWSTEEKLLHVRKLDSRLHPSQDKVDADADVRKNLEPVFQQEKSVF